MLTQHMKEIEKAYIPKNYEDTIYKEWEKSGFFNPDNLPGKRKKQFSILMPPPNVTGILHLGHAMEQAIMDTMVRYKRMSGELALLVPGVDHAAVATQSRVEKNLIKEGVKNPREEYGREKLLNTIRAHAEESKEVIVNQIKELGTSCDWDRFVYTLDDKRAKAVNTVFKKMYDDGLVYKGYRVVNWSVKGQSTCSDDELVHVERKGKLYTFKYAKDFPFAISTTRPETKLGDTAVAVNPKDKRYKKYIGLILEADVGAEKPLKLKVIADELIDPEFGTGAVGVTPAHSQVDFDMYEKNGYIELIKVIDIDGKMTKEAGKNYEGLEVEEARKKFVKWLKKEKLLIDEKEIIQNVGTSDRFEDIVEVIPMEQWFVNVTKEIPGKNKSLKDLMREAVTTGLNGKKSEKVTIEPERFEKVYLYWIDGLRDWCISRQIWWGHQIPVWYKGEKVYSGITPPEGDAWEQDPDTLDTWFSSGLWSFSTLGFPEKTEDLKVFHPTTFMQMGYEILFFWMARMILMTGYTLNTVPFHNVYIHGMVRDKDGRKFSKSLGNGIDPREVGKEYGNDALRVSLMSDIAAGNDSRFYFEKVTGSRNLINKLWNISRYILMSINKVDISKKPKSKTLADKWILERLDETITNVSDNLEKYKFANALEALTVFTRDDFADWYIEVSKIEGDKDEILLYVLQNILKMWHPFAPFVTEAIWGTIKKDKSDLLMIQEWPTAKKKSVVPEEWDTIKNCISMVRHLKNIYRIPPKTMVPIVLASKKNEKLFTEHKQIIEKLARVSVEKIEKGKVDRPEKSIQFSLASEKTGLVEVYLNVEGIIDIDKEKKRIEKEVEKLESYRNGINKKLENQKFLKNAPAKVVEEEKQKAHDAGEKITHYKQQLELLS